MKKIIFGLCAVLVLNGAKVVGSRVYPPLHDDSNHSALTATQKVWEETTEPRQLQPYEFENVVTLVAYVADSNSSAGTLSLEPEAPQISNESKPES